MSLKTGAQGEAKSVHFERCSNLFSAVNDCGQSILMCSGDNSAASSADLYEDGYTARSVQNKLKLGNC